jgi:23S rRNA (guanosine2251-2'-O)-methyltransferase
MIRKLTMPELQRADVEKFHMQNKLPVSLVLDNIRSAHNAGSIFRTADAFAVEKIYLCGITAVPPNRELLKTSLGAEKSISWEFYKNVYDCLNHLKKENYRLIAIEQANPNQTLDAFKPTGEKVAFIFGNEVSGISDSVLEIIEEAVEIPQFGTKHSFNVATTAGIVLWDYYLKMK